MGASATARPGSGAPYPLPCEATALAASLALPAWRAWRALCPALRALATPTPTDGGRGRPSFMNEAPPSAGRPRPQPHAARRVPVREAAVCARDGAQPRPTRTPPAAAINTRRAPPRQPGAAPNQWRPPRPAVETAQPGSRPTPPRTSPAQPGPTATPSAGRPRQRCWQPPVRSGST